MSSVAALVPAYQAAAFIQETLDSLSAQRWPEFTVLVSVDLSDDSTLQICQAHAARDPRFRVFSQAERLGWIGNSNFLLRQARAGYAMFAFHDDLLAPDCVPKLAAALDARPEVVLAYPDTLVTKVNGSQEPLVYTALEGLTERLPRAMTMLKKEGLWYAPNRGLFRLELARRIGGLKRHGAGEFAADWPWLFHMSLLGEFHRVPETLCYKFYKKGSLSRTWQISHEQWVEVGASAMREIWNADIPTDEKLVLAVPLIRGLIDVKRTGQELRRREDQPPQ